MRSSNLKASLSHEIESQTEAFLSQGRMIEQVPINHYRHEQVTLRDRAAILAVNRSSISQAHKQKSGDAQRAIDKQSWELKRLKGSSK